MGLDKKKKILTVGEVKSIAALADVYEINPQGRYLVTIPKSNLVGGNDNANAKGQQIAHAFKTLNIPVCIMIGIDSNVEIMELKVEKN